MKYALLATLLLCLGDQDPPVPRVTGDQWIVIFQIKRDNITEPYMEMRAIVKADSEGEAALTASKALNRILSATAYDGLKFIEAAPKQAR